MRLPFLSRRQSTRSAEQPIGYYLNAGGQLEPLLAGKASGLAGLTMHGYGAYSRMPITSTPQGYAYASIASVWAFRCIELRSQACNRVRWFVRQVDSDKEIPNHPLTIALRRSRQKIIRKLEWSKLIWGETFIYPRPNLSGYISDLSWLNNLGVTVDTTPGYVREFQYMPVNGGPMIRFAPEELAYLYTDNPFDDLRGLSRFESVLVDIGIDRDVARTTRAFYLNDTRVGLLLLTEQNLSPDQRQQIMDFWKANLKGPENAGKPVILPNAISDVKEVQRAPSIDDVDLRESVRRAICAGFGVPLSLAGAWDDAQYQSAPEQRKSFYEETVIPECEEIRDDLNDVLMPFFDDKRASEIDFDASGLLALTENAAEKETMLNARLTSGGIMLNEYRATLEIREVPGGNVFYVPGGITRVPEAEIGLPMPPPQPSQPFAFPGLSRPPLLPNGGNGNGTPVQEQRAALPIHTYDAPRLDTPIVITKQADADEELDAWERKALNGGATKALKFACNHLDADIQAFVRDGLADAADKAACRRVFALARSHLRQELQTATPEEYHAYWQRFDDLMAQVGDEWLNDYMARAFDALDVTANTSDADIERALSGFRDELVSGWVGTTEEPGPLAQIMLAGMAAGNDALQRGRMPKPMRAAGDIGIDWSLLPHEALAFVRTYLFDLIRRLDTTTREATRKAITDWMHSGEPLPKLKDALRLVFHDRNRASVIAETEATRAYSEGAFQRFQDAGVQQVKWQTVNDGHVCFVCADLHNQTASIHDGWQSNVSGKIVRPPAHPRCRCFPKPVLP